MAAKTEKKGAAAMMPNTEKTEFENEMDMNEKISILMEENKKLKESYVNLQNIQFKCEELEEENFRLNGLVLEPAATTRTALLLALAPNMNLAYPREDAQRIEKAVDEILKVWGFSCDL